MEPNDKLLSDLFTKLAQNLLAKVESGEATAADLNVVRQFLKDNGVDSVPRSSKPLQGLIDSLPDVLPGDEILVG